MHCVLGTDFVISSLVKLLMMLTVDVLLPFPCGQSKPTVIIVVSFFFLFPIFMLFNNFFGPV